MRKSFTNTHSIGFLEDFFSSSSATKTIYHFSIAFIISKKESDCGFAQTDNN